MADEIKQVLGFDAAQALDALNLLDQGFAKLQSNLQSSVSTFSTFNAGAGKTVSALIQITSRANEAADALNRLNTIKAPPSIPGGGLPALPGGNASQGLLTGTAAAQAMNQLLGQTTTAANAAGNAVANAGTQATNALNNAGRSASGFALNLETISRVIGTQVIVRALNSIRTAVEDSFEGFIQFNRAIATIQTISPEPVENLAKQVRQLSDEFNAPILDVAKAKYDIVSNGFQTAAESTSILTAALKLSKIGLSDTAQAADLLATILNAYGKSASEAETLSAKLFKTVDVGRVTISELTNSFGRVAPIAKEVGATEDEILAAFSSITIGGVKASEAATQIRAALSSLLKPSGDAEKALRTLGFETGEQLIRARGFQGALQALISTTDGSTSAIAKLFPNVRALNGVLRETGTGVDVFKENLKEIQLASRDLLNSKFEIRVSSDAEKVSADLNKIKNFFTADLGAQLVSTTASFFKLFGGVDTVLGAMKALAPVVAIAVGGLVAYNVVTLTAAGVTRALATSFGTAAGSAAIFGGAISGLVAIVAAVQAGQFIGDRITTALNRSTQLLKDNANELLAFQREQSEARSNLDKIESDKKFALLNNQVAVARKAYFEQTDAAKEANKQLLDDDKSTIDKIIAGREKFAQDLRRAAQQADTDVIDSRKRVNDVQGQLDDQRFNNQNKRFNDATKAFRDQQRALDLAAQGASKLGSASKPEEKEAAQSAFARAESFARQAISSAQTSGNLGQQIAAERTLESILQRRIDAEKVFQKNRQDDAQKLQQAAAAESARITQLKTLAKDFLDNASLFDSKGDLLPKDQIDKQVATAKDKLAQFRETAFGNGAQFNLDDLFSFDKLQQRLESSLTQGEVKSLFASDTSLDRLRQQVQGAFDKSSFIVSLAVDPKKLEGKSQKEQIDEVSSQFKDQQESLDRLRASSVARAAAEQEIASNIALANTSLKEGKSDAEAFAGVLQIAFSSKSFDALRQAKTDLSNLRLETQRLLTDTAASAEQINSLAGKFEAFQTTSPTFLKFDINRASEEFKNLTRVFELRKQINALDAQGQTNPALQNTQQVLDTQAREAAAKAAADAEAKGAASTTGAATAAESMKTSFNSSVSATAQIASNMRAAQSAAEAAARASNAIDAGGSAARPETAALGGMIQRFSTGGVVQAQPQFHYFNSGGAAKGTDTIPAMLSQHEQVINARSSQKFFSQLQAINAGAQPSFNSPNRSGDTINIGDINVNGANDPKATAREVINLIRREQRRGTGSRF